MASMQYSTGEDGGAAEPAGAPPDTADRRIGDLAVQLGHESMVATLQDGCVAQAVESASAELFDARLHLSCALARVERAQDGLTEARRLLGRREATQRRISRLVAALVAACSQETGFSHGTNDRQDPDDLNTAGSLARRAGPA